MFTRLLATNAQRESSTNLTLIKTEVGIIEPYRGIEPSMDEIALKLDTAVELADH